MADRAIRLAALGLTHEANTFSISDMDEATMQQSGVLFGQQIIARHREGTSTMSGFLSAASFEGVEIAPLVMTNLVPRGPITADGFDARVVEMVTALQEGGPFDGVLAALHGAAVAHNHLDADGYLLRRIREVVGPDVPIGVSLDLHANISAEMCKHVDVLNTYRTNPHLDAKQVALEVAELVIRTVRGEVRPTLAFEPLPAAINILCQNTGSRPMSDVMADVAQTMAEPGVLSATVSEGFPYADVPEMGMAVAVVTDGNPRAAAHHAKALAKKVWEMRELFEAQAPSAADAIDHVRQDGEGPTLLLDVGDNIGGGGPGDSVVLLNAAIDAGLESLLIIVADEAAVAACEATGVGGRLQVSIGAKSYPETGPAVDAIATVLAFDDGVYEVTGEKVHGGVLHIDAGRSCAIRLESGQTVILTSKVALPFSLQQLTAVGLEAGQFRAIVAKGVHSPQSTYAPYVREMVLVDTPGPTSANLRRFCYVHRRRPMFPFEPDAVFEPITGDAY